MRHLIQCERLINRFSDLFGWLSATLFLMLVFNVFYDVIARYAFNTVSIALQEMEWHLFSAVFMLAIPYALKAGGHVRVDIIYEKLSQRAQALIDIVGTLLFLLPFTLLVFYYGIDFAKEAYSLGESSGDPGGLPYRWIIKAMIPVAFLSIAISGIGLLLHSLNRIFNPHLFHQHEREQ
ncbi:TRAP transporter small permease subunit [Thaumasiovibrio sp. DFM-14]|uniref:TRAP transporter small permease subunit n=1 Tax=Thaumasiovibrio sp. DFM-14 TaxID=3384792 RepID=UPI00399F7D64